MPHSLYATDTDLTADNLLRLPAEFGCPVWVYDAQIIRARLPSSASLTWYVLRKKPALTFISCV